MAYTILFRRGTDNEWTQANPVLKLGELGFVTDTKRFKIGDGLTNWNSLPYSVATLENGKIPLDQIPDLSKIAVYEVSTIAQRDLLTVQSGDLATVSETNKTYVYDGSSWVEFLVNPDLTGYATEQYVDDSIDNLNLSQYQNLQQVNDIVDNAIAAENLDQYATETFLAQTIAALDLPDSELFQVNYQNDSVIYGSDVPASGSGSSQYSYASVTGIGDGIFPTANGILQTYPNASAAYYTTVVGTGSMSAAIFNYENTAVGYATLQGGGFKNVAIGNNALGNIAPHTDDSLVTPDYAVENTAVGYQSMLFIEDGSSNTALGAKSMFFATSGSANIALGANALSMRHDTQPFDGSNAVAIGASAGVPASNVIKIGSGNQKVVIDNPVFKYADSRDMTSVTNITYGLDFINALRPVEYQSNARFGVESMNQLGFLASEVISASPSFSGYVDFNSDGADIKALAYDQFIPPIVKSIQQLDLRVVDAESDLSTVAVLSASVAALSASVTNINQGDAVYETYTISSVGTDYFVSASPGDANPQITLVAGRRYRFDLTGVNSSQPLAFRLSDSVTSDVVGMTGNDPVNGISGSSPSNYVFFSVPSSPPYGAIIYQSSATQSMGGIVDIVNP